MMMMMLEKDDDENFTKYEQESGFLIFFLSDPLFGQNWDNRIQCCVLEVVFNVNTFYFPQVWYLLNSSRFSPGGFQTSESHKICDLLKENSGVEV